MRSLVLRAADNAGSLGTRMIAISPSAGAGDLAERGEFRLGQRDFGCCDILFEMGDLRCSGNRQHDWAALEEPGERDLARARVVRLRDLRQFAARLDKIAGGEREPRHEADALLLAMLEEYY